MAIKAAFFDIDGTLVSFKTHQIPASTIKAIEQAKEQGVKIFIFLYWRRRYHFDAYSRNRGTSND